MKIATVSWGEISLSRIWWIIIGTELCDEADWHSLATKIVYRAFLKRWICPYWGKTSIYAIRTIAVERWLRWLRRTDGNLLGDSTKAKIRNLLSVLFNHAIRYEWFSTREGTR